jgi:predicted DNA-binding transcriptional regulator AlpA
MVTIERGRDPQTTNGGNIRMKNLSLPETGFVRLPVVLAVFPVSKSSLYAGIQKGIYPAPVKLSERTSAWKVEDIRLLIEQKSVA